MNDQYGLTAENLLSALPDALRLNERLVAIAHTTADLLAARPAEIDAIRVFPNIDSASEELLDLLAYDFKVDWYGYDYPVEVKRNLIKSNFYVHRHLGTRGAVAAAIQSLYPNSCVEEWFDYDDNGKPYSFRIVIDAADPAPVSNKELLRAVRLYKSYRSHLDGIMIRTMLKLKISTSVGWCAYSVRLCGTYPITAIEGSILDGCLTTETATGAVDYSAPLCGLDPGTLFSGGMTYD